MTDNQCVYEDEYGRCKRPIKVKKYGWCTKHYTRWNRYGDPSINHLPGKERFIALSRGGKHSYENTRIAHWICNVRRWTGERSLDNMIEV